MSIVRFAMLCDKRGTRSEEYTPWATCRECGLDFCPKCSTEPTEDESNKCICLDCKAEVSK